MIPSATKPARLSILAAVVVPAMLVGCGAGSGVVEPTRAVSPTPDPPLAASPTVLATGSATAAPDNVGGDVSAGEVTLGGVIVSLSLQPARHLIDQATVQTADAAQQQQAAEARKASLAAPEGANPQLVQEAVVLSGMARVTNNIDPFQVAPADTPDVRIRHAIVRVRTRDGQPVPYLTLTMDVLLDGRPISYEQAVLPMAATEVEATELYYGNNVKFGPRGTYQLFVRIQRSPFLGKDQPQAALFNLVLR